MKIFTISFFALIGFGILAVSIIALSPTLMIVLPFKFYFDYKKQKLNPVKQKEESFLTSALTFARNFKTPTNVQ